MAGLLQPVLASSFADREWALMRPANEHEAAGRYDEALPYWIQLVDLYSSENTAGALENGGHVARKIGNYYAGHYSSRNFNADLATTYYEKAKELYTRANALGRDLLWAISETDALASRYRTTIRAYAQMPIANRRQTRPLAKHEPAGGVILGIYAEREARYIDDYRLSLNLLDRDMGRNHTSILFYCEWGVTAFPTRYAQDVAAQGGSLQVAMQPMAGLDAVRDGDYIRSWARAANASGVPIFLRFAGEMNGDWTAWDGNPRLYIEKFRLVHGIMQQEAPNVAMVWAPNDSPWVNYDEFYPGDAYVDWVGVSSYTMLRYTSSTKEQVLGSSPITRLSHIVNLYGSRKPIMIVEFAAAHRAPSEPQINYDDWAINNLRKLYSYVPRVYPEIKAIFYFSDNTSRGNYSLVDRPSILQAYRDQISSDYFLRSMTQPASYYYQDIGNGDITLGPVRISAYVETLDPVVSRVEYELRNISTREVRSLGRSTSLPFELDVDFSGLTSGSHELIVKAYDSQGASVGTANFVITGSGSGTAAPTPTPTPSTPSTSITVYPTRSTVFVNGEAIAFDAYTIGGSNYFKLRDLAYVINGTNKQFAVGYDSATREVTMTSGQSYTSTSGDMTLGDGSSKRATLNSSINITLDGEPVQVRAYMISGNNFVRLRDIMRLHDVYVDYDIVTRNIIIDTSRSYES